MKLLSTRGLTKSLEKMAYTQALEAQYGPDMKSKRPARVLPPDEVITGYLRKLDKFQQHWTLDRAVLSLTAIGKEVSKKDLIVSSPKLRTPRKK